MLESINTLRCPDFNIRAWKLPIDPVRPFKLPSGLVGKCRNVFRIAGNPGFGISKATILSPGERRPTKMSNRDFLKAGRVMGERLDHDKS
jgi:hypothetical protein